MLRLDFSDVRNEGWNYAGWEVWLDKNNADGINLSADAELVFSIKGSTGGEEPNVWLMTPILDDYERFYKDVGEVIQVNSSWQQVVIPLWQFTLGQKPHEHVDLEKIRKIQIVFEWYPEPTSGTIFIDNLCVQ